MVDLAGDSIVPDSNQVLVVQRQGAVTVTGTPRGSGPATAERRGLLDATAVNDSTRPPTTGFKTVTNWAHLQLALENASPNTVIQIPAGVTIPIEDLPNPVVFPAGVTLRGGRRGVDLGPLI